MDRMEKTAWHVWQSTLVAAEQCGAKVAWQGEHTAITKRSNRVRRWQGLAALSEDQDQACDLIEAPGQVTAFCWASWLHMQVLQRSQDLWNTDMHLSTAISLPSSQLRSPAVEAWPLQTEQPA